MFFQVGGEFFCHRRDIRIRRQFQVGIQPVATPVFHPVRFIDCIKRKQRLELKLGIIRNIFHDAGYRKGDGIPAIMSDCFSNRICISE